MRLIGENERGNNIKKQKYGKKSQVLASDEKFKKIKFLEKISG